jgi:hypothetical protein
MSTSRFAAAAAVLALSFLAALTAAARATVPEPPPGAVDLGWSSAARIDGVDTDMRMFEAKGTPLGIAGLVLEHMQPRPSLMSWPGGLMMSGIDGRRFWSLQLRETDGGRTRGLLAIRDAGAGRVSAPPSWMPPDARLLFDARGRSDGSPAQQVYAHGLDPIALTRLLKSRLSAQGWRQAGASGNWQEWRRTGQRVRWVAVPSGAGSGVLLVLEAGADGQDR